jgi:hypothetical protein
MHEIERRKRIMLIEVIELAEQNIPRSKRSAVELAHRAIIRIAQKRRVEIGFRY